MRAQRAVGDSATNRFGGQAGCVGYVADSEEGWKPSRAQLGAAAGNSACGHACKCETKGGHGSVLALRIPVRRNDFHVLSGVHMSSLVFTCPHVFPNRAFSVTDITVAGDTTGTATCFAIKLVDTRLTRKPETLNPRC